jgi:nucleotide-binding universal stress UspA family protein
LPALLERVVRPKLAEFGAHVRLISNGRSVAGAIAAFLADNPCDLVIVGIHAHRELEFPRTAELARSLLHRKIGSLVGVPLGEAAHIDEPPAYHSILAPTDLSELGNRAIAHAYSLVRGGSVTLLYVYLTPEGSPGALETSQRTELELRLLALVPENADTRGTATNVLIIESANPAHAIVDTATRLGCDIICMGSHGRSALGRVILGSVAEEVLHHFPKAVLIVR